MTRPTLTDLAAKRAKADHYWPVGSHIRHQKSQNIYEIMFHSTRESDAETLITFRPIAYDDLPPIYVIGQPPVDERDAYITRPLIELSEIVTEGDYTGPRFTKVVKQETWVDV